MRRELGGRVDSNIVDDSWICTGPLPPPPPPPPPPDLPRRPPPSVPRRVSTAVGGPIAWLSSCHNARPYGRFQKARGGGDSP
eukprot:181060-Pyramimonas_sp.AAC.1